jgi:sugar lactone lactonase YvrE
MPQQAVPPRLTAAVPSLACPGALVQLEGDALVAADGGLPEVWLGGARARITAASVTRLSILVGDDVPGGEQDVRVSGVAHGVPLRVARAIATDVHQVDGPAVDRAGRVYATFSGSRGQQVPVSIFRISAGGLREPFSSAVVNPTSTTIGPDQALYVTSRFEGAVYRLADDGSAALVASNLGVACGLAFASDGVLYVGDRSGTIFRVSVETGSVSTLVELPASVAAFHLAFGPDGWLYVTGPTLSPVDPVRRVDPSSGRVEIVCEGLGRPQGIAFDAAGVLHVADALAGASGIYAVDGGVARLAIAGRRLVGLAFDADGAAVVASNDTLYRFDPLPRAGERAGTPHDQER